VLIKRAVSQSTIDRELATIRVESGIVSSRHTDSRRSEAAKASKITPAMISAIESKLRIECSAEPISGWLLEDKGAD
jgi:IS30 family transposase